MTGPARRMASISKVMTVSGKEDFYIDTHWLRARSWSQGVPSIAMAGLWSIKLSKASVVAGERAGWDDRTGTDN